MIELTLPGMTCGSCARGVIAAIKSVDQTAEVVAEVALRKVSITTTADIDAVKNAVRDAGYTPA